MGILIQHHLRHLMRLKFNLNSTFFSRLLALFSLVLLQLLAVNSAQAQSIGADFDHNSTGFVLTTQHQTARCESCHVKGIFRGTPKTCDACHGWNNPRSGFFMPRDHIPGAALTRTTNQVSSANLSCESCHTGNLATFADASRAFNHALVANRITCNECHDGKHSNVVGPPTGAADRTGIHTSVVQNKTSCGTCHASTSVFTGGGMPGNHIPIASGARCDACHVDLTNYAAMPSITAIHANAPSGSSNCAQCHSAANAVRYSSPRMSPALVGTPANHIPMGTLGCEACHVGTNSSMSLPVTDGAKFSNSAFDHNGITSSCATCHGPTVTPTTFYGVSPKTQAGLSPVHVPNPGNLPCETCHLGSIPSGQIPAGGPAGTQATFANGVFSHSGISTGCEACHGASVAPNAYYGITLKTTGSLSPAHIPTTAACTTCHVNSIPSTPVPATGQTSGTTFANGQMDHSATSASCDTCHGSGISAASFYGISNIVVMPPTAPAGSSSHIPTSLACDVCHTKPVGAYALTAWPTNKTFQSPLAQGPAIHTGISGGCNACHDVSVSSAWLGMNLYPATQTGVAPNTQSRGFQVRPVSNHPTGGDCSLCHNSTVYFSTPTPPANHIPYSPAATCGTCHTDPNFLTTPTLANIPSIGVIHANIVSKTTNCVECHSVAKAAYYASSTTVRPIVTDASVSNHIPMGGQSCEACHMGANSSITGAQVVDGDKFTNSAFSHTGASGTCASCHANGTNFTGVSPKSMAGLAPAHVPNPGNLGCESCHTTVPTMQIPAAGATGNMTKFSAGVQYLHTGISTGCDACHGSTVTSTSFYGITNIVVIPPTSPAGPSAHIPTTAACEACHSKPTGAVGANATTTAPGTGFQTPVPTGPAIHAGVTNNCNTCHDVTASTTWMGMNKYLPTSSGGKYYGFQIRPTANNHPTGGDCSVCHASTLYFSSPTAPANHIPYSASASCGTCHTDPNFLTTPTLATIPSVGVIHANIQSKTTNCVQCHSVTNAALYASSTTVRPIVTDRNAANHIPMGGQSCETCHMGANSSITGAQVADNDKFTNSAFSHAGSSSVCANCHGGSATYTGVSIKSTAGLSPVHVPNPANLGCEACHTTVPTMQIPVTGASTGMTTFATNTKFSHSGITSGCAACHGASVNSGTFYGITNIVVIPPTGIPGASSHLPTSASCETCHAGSVPTALVAANASRTAPGTAFQTPVPTAAMIHTGITGSCSSCHDTNFVWMGMDKYPITTSAPFRGFQTRPQASSGTFFVADSLHPPGECSQCHSSFINFNGPSAPSNHIPYAANVQCAACHVDFTSVPTVAKIHANIQNTSGNCAQCHSAANSAVYSANMQQVIKTIPAQHIPMGSATCESCHVGAGSSIAATPVPDGASFANSLFNHAGSTATCATCHGETVTATTFTGIYPKTKQSLSPAHVPTTAACDLCHVNSVPSGQVPATGMTTFANGQFTHSGITNGCSSCHGSGVTADAGGYFFAGINRLIVLPSTANGAHIPASNVATCEACHVVPSSPILGGNSSKTVPGTDFGNKPSSAQIHSGVSGSCVSCHEGGLSWLGVAKYTRDSAVSGTQGATYKGFQTRPGTPSDSYAIADSGHQLGELGTADCAQCHSGFISFGTYAAPANHIPYKTGVQCGACHASFTVANAPVAKGSASIHSNFASNTTNCAQCHSAANAALYASTTTAYPIKTPSGTHVDMGSLGCESCHTVANTMSSFNSFAGGLFSHSGITTGCSACHGINVSSSTFDGLPNIVATGTLAPAHIPVSNNVSCETCHTNSIPTALVPASGYAGTPNFSGAKFIHTTITSNCEQCHGPASTGTVYKGIALTDIVRIPATSPAGSSSHIPTTAACANCHLASLPSGLTVGVNTATTNTGFRLPAPTSTMIHSGVTSGCSDCHNAPAGWIGMDLYPRSPSTYVQNAPNTQYTGFQTRPQSTATGYSVGNGGHPTNGDCSQCHGSFAYFGQPTLPAGHIPYATGAACAACHVTWGTPPTNVNIHANIQSTTGNCVQCHSTANAALYAATITKVGGIVTPNTNAPVHIPMRNLGCEACHTASNTMSTWTNFGSAKFSHTGMNTNCAECHASNVGPFQGITRVVNTTATVGSVAHMPFTAACETCHLASMPSALVDGNVAAPVPGSGFRMASNPPTSAQIHTGVSTCNSCHDKDLVWLSMDVYPKTSAAPFKGFQTRPYASATTFSVADSAHPTGGDCSTCHTGYTEWLAQVMPNNHIPTAAVPCANCHVAVSGVTNYTNTPTVAAIHANAPSTTANCAQCHSATNAAKYSTPNSTPAMTINAPDNTHIAMAALGCESCHVGANSSFTSVPVTSQSASWANAAFDHSGSSTVCANCHGNSITNTTFQGGQIPKTMLGLSPIHVPNPANLGCEACHQAVPTGQVRLGSATTTFATNSKYSHSGITTGCDACHGSTISGTSFYGISRIVVLSNYSAASGTNSHIPAPNNAACQACHLANTPSGLISPNATAGAVAWGGASGFFTPAPTGAQIHSSISTVACTLCHEAGLTWTGVSKYPRSPATYIANSTYTGFHTRPTDVGAVNSIVDAHHPDVSFGDCSKCHGSTTSFSVASMPTNHIPIGTTVDCNSCHTNITATNKDFSAHVDVLNIHRYGPSTTSSNCGQCHSTANATYYSIPSISYTVVGAAANHVPYGTTNCTVCHTLPATTTSYTSFAGGQYTHSGVTTGCDVCHGSPMLTKTFQGITSIVTMTNYTQSSGTNAHIPALNNATCEACHIANVPSGLIAANAVSTAPTQTGFYSPAPNTTQIHSGSPTNCVACHEQNMTWGGMQAKYPRSPAAVQTGASYTGFHTRPNAAGTGFSILDNQHPTTGDCDLCHVGTTAFTGVGKPTGHIQTSATCATCHTTAGDYSVAGLTTVKATLHPGITATVANPPSVPSISCVTCHANANPSTLAFAGCKTQTVADCSGTPQLIYYPMGVGGNPTTSGAGTVSHVPISTLDCVACHGSVSVFSGTTMGSKGHSNAISIAKIACQSCHLDSSGMYNSTGGLSTNTGSWTNASVTRRPSSHSSKSATPASPNSKAYPNDCVNCHKTYNGGFRGLARPVPVVRVARLGTDSGRLLPNLQGGTMTRGSLGNTFDHQGVEVGKCKTCHDGKSASGLPARHLMSTVSCDTCHRTSTWKPAQFSHNGISPNTCLACHNGMNASTRPAGHFMSGRSCDSCHKAVGWKPVTYNHMSPNYRPTADAQNCVGCHATNSEIIPRQARAQIRVKPVVGP